MHDIAHNRWLAYYHMPDYVERKKKLQSTIFSVIIAAQSESKNWVKKKPSLMAARDRSVQERLQKSSVSHGSGSSLKDVQNLCNKNLAS